MNILTKVQNFAEVMGYAGYTTGLEEDRRKLYINKMLTAKRKSDGKQFGVTIFTRSIGSGKESRFTIPIWRFNKTPVRSGQVIFCKNFKQNGIYYNLLDYEIVV